MLRSSASIVTFTVMLAVGAAGCASDTADESPVTIAVQHDTLDLMQGAQGEVTLTLSHAVPELAYRLVAPPPGFDGGVQAHPIGVSAVQLYEIQAGCETPTGLYTLTVGVVPTSEQPATMGSFGVRVLASPPGCSGQVDVSRRR